MTKSVLVMAAGRRVYVVRELVQAALPEAKVYVSDVHPWAPALYVEGAVPLHRDQALADPATWLSEACLEHEVGAVLSLHDYEGHWLAGLRESLAEHGTLFIGPDLPTAATLIDKAALSDHLLRNAPELAIPTHIWDGHGHNPVEACSEIGWVVKDRHGSGSSGLRLCADLESVAQACMANAERVGWHPEVSTAPVESVIQPHLKGVEFNVDLFFDADGSICGHCVKAKQAMRGGETDAARVFRVAPEDTLAAAIRATHGLRLIGNVDIDLVKTVDGRFGVLDINPRFGGGYAFSQAAGYRVASAVWSIANGVSFTSPILPLRDLCAVKYLEVETVPMMDVGNFG